MKDVKRTNAGSSGDEDPFADLVRTIERDPHARASASQKAYGGFEPVEVPQSSWEHFSYVPAPGAPSAARIEPVGAAPSARPQVRRTAAEADAEIEEALRGLSQPARPRVNAPAETQSFAPARLDDHFHAPQHTMTSDDFDELIASELAAMRPLGATAVYDDEEDDYADEADDRRRPVRVASGRRGAPLYAGLLFLALVAGGGAYVFAGGGVTAGSGGDGLLIKADAEPYKIAPADPGGRTIPNQNKAVYDRVAAGAASLAPTQQALVTAIEEPVELPADEESTPFDLPGVSYGEAIPSETAAEVASVSEATGDDSQTLQPRRVRTLTVRPDGSLVVDEVPAEPAAMIEAASQAAPAEASALSDDVSQMITSSTMNAGLAASAAVPVVAPEAPAVVAALPPVAATGEGFFVQIASQPNEAAARESLDNMARRYAKVIGSRSLGIQAAEIEGRGTFYRVRVATATRSEAISLCESLKSAGGSCFVTR